MAYASPTSINPPPEPGPSSYVKGTVILLVLSLALLLVAKWVYQSQRCRQTSFGSEDSWRARSLRSQLGDNLFSSENALCKPPKEKGKSGLLVGLFGSPSWETRYSNMFQMASEQVSLNHALHLAATPHRHGSNYRFTTSPQSKQAEDSSFARCYSHHLSQAELGLQTFCEPLLVGPPPAMTSNTYPPWSLNRPVSSHASNDLFQSSRFGLLFDPTVRLIPDCGAHRDCIFNFPESTHCNTPGSHDSLPSSLSNCKSMHVHSWDAGTRVRSTSRSALESKPHFCHSSNRSSQPKPFQTIPRGVEAAVEQAESIYLISPPSTPISLSKQSTGSTSGQGCNESLSSKHNWTMPIFASRHAVDALGPSMKRENATIPSPAYVSVIDVDGAVGDVKPNLRTSSSSQQQKLNPKIGRSPLRTMFLHDSGDTDNKFCDISETNHASIEESLPRSNSRIIDNAKLSSGHRRKPYRYQTKLRAKGFKERTKNQDSESLFDLIQELVRETNAWDDSLFVDHKFRAMIDDSKQVIAVSLPNKHKGWRRSHRLRHPSTRVLEGIPEMEAEITLEEEDEAAKQLKLSECLFRTEDPPDMIGIAQ
ncbi:hypothetical protein BJ912DRAFT_1137520 [Pholiota molesta]|nr:hypothetical protein BJ912DRAFT_1137520 [Pholiota molesta]